MRGWILLPVFLPMISGICLLVSSFRGHLRATETGITAEDTDAMVKRRLHLWVGIILVISAVLAVAAAFSGEKSVTLFYLMKDIPVYFQIDGLSRIFVTFVSIIWVSAGIYSFSYMEHEGEETRFFGFYLLVYGILVALDFSGNLVTMYFFYELVTLASMPLVLHNGSREAVMAALEVPVLFYVRCLYGIVRSLFPVSILRYSDVYSGRFFESCACAGESRNFIDCGICAAAGLWCKGRNAAVSCMASHSPSRGAFSGVCSTFRSYCKIRSAGSDPGRLLCCRCGFYQRDLGTDCVDDPDAYDSVYGIHAGIPGAGVQKEAGIFYGKPDFLYFIRLVPAVSGGDDRRIASHSVSCIYKVFPVPDGRCFYF